MHDQLTLAELDDQSVELLPDRETLFFDTVGVWATNSSMAPIISSIINWVCDAF